MVNVLIYPEPTHVEAPVIMQSETEEIFMKNGTTVRNLIEAIGILSVIGSLIFVGMELRQNSIATRAATNSAIAESFLELNMVLASNPELARALSAWVEDPSEAPREDQILILSLWRGVFHIWSNAHRQHLNDTLDPAIYTSIVQEIKTYALPDPQASNIEDVTRRQRLMRWAWESERFIFNPDFQEFMDNLLGIKR